MDLETVQENCDAKDLMDLTFKNDIDIHIS